MVARLGDDVVTDANPSILPSGLIQDAVASPAKVPQRPSSACMYKHVTLK